MCPQVDPDPPLPDQNTALCVYIEYKPHSSILILLLCSHRCAPWGLTDTLGICHRVLGSICTACHANKISLNLNVSGKLHFPAAQVTGALSSFLPLLHNLCPFDLLLLFALPSFFMYVYQSSRQTLWKQDRRLLLKPDFACRPAIVYRAVKILHINSRLALADWFRASFLTALGNCFSWERGVLHAQKSALLDKCSQDTTA